MRKYNIIGEYYGYGKGCGFKKDWRPHNEIILAENRFKALDKYKEKYPNNKVVKMISYGMEIKL